MQNVLSPIVDMYQANIEASRKMIEVMFTGTEKIDRVVIEATHHAVDEQLRMAQSAASSKDGQSISSMQANFFKKPDGAMPYQQEIMRIFTDIQNEMGRSMQTYFDQLRSKMSNVSGAPLQSAQQRTTEAVVNPLSGIFSFWESAFQDVASVANKNLAAGRSTFESATAAARQSSGTSAADVTDVVANAVNVDRGSDASASSETSNDLNSSMEYSGNGRVEGSSDSEMRDEKRSIPGGSKRK